MLNRRLIVFGGVGDIAAFAAAVLLFSNNDPTPVPPIVSDTPSATPAADTDHSGHSHESDPAFAAKYPVLRLLPHEKMWWRVDLGSDELGDGTVDLQAFVFVGPGGDNDAILATQEPFIRAWIEQTGQAKDTYELELIPVREGPTDS